ncbi:MAG: hypothetical protein ABSH41_11410 [Syntrophobacteraceae bacterium]|jgi:hypothetical protein
MTQHPAEDQIANRNAEPDGGQIRYLLRMDREEIEKVLSSDKLTRMDQVA